jgi:hypothetical protein
MRLPFAIDCLVVTIEPGSAPSRRCDGYQAESLRIPPGCRAESHAEQSLGFSAQDSFMVVKTLPDYSSKGRLPSMLNLLDLFVVAKSRYRNRAGKRGLGGM